MAHMDKIALIATTVVLIEAVITMILNHQIATVLKHQEMAMQEIIRLNNQVVSLKEKVWEEK